MLEPLGLEYAIEDKYTQDIETQDGGHATLNLFYSTTNRSAATSLVAMTGGGGETSGGEGSGSSSASFGSVETNEIIDVWGEMESGIRDLLSEEGRVSVLLRELAAYQLQTTVQT